MADEKIEQQKTTFSDEELAGLSEQEREALLEKGDDDLEALRTIAGEGDDDDVDADAKAEAERKAAEEKAAAEAKAKEEAEAKAAEGERKKREAELAAMSEEDRKKAEAADKAATDAADAAAKAKADADAKAEADAKARAEAEEDEPLITTYRAEPPENYDAQVKALNERKATAEAKYHANEIEIKEMLAERDAADAELRKLDEQKLKAEISAEQQEQASQQRWQWEVNRFMRNVAKHEGIDYKVSNMLNAALDAEVKRLANDEANKDKSGEWFLETAHESLKTALGLKPTKPSVDDKGAKDAVAREKADKEAKEKAESERRKQADANRDKLHKGLGGLPAAGGGGGEPGGEGEFANLDGLSGMDLEYAVAKLTPEQQDRYSRAS